MRLPRTADRKKVRTPESGITMIETLMAGAILVIGSISMLTLIVSAIATNNRNKVDSTQTMLATSILEQINSTLIGTGTSSLTDCKGTTFRDRKSTRLNSSHQIISYAVFCLKKKNI